MRVAILTSSTMKKTIDGKQFSGKCITGLDLENNKIVRFVRNELGAPIENPFCDFYQPLNVYNVKHIANCPLACQTENIIVDYCNPHFEGEHAGGIEDLYKRFQEIKYDDTSFMLDGSYKLQNISPFKHSLEIIKATDIRLEMKKASFNYNGKVFKFVSVTDPAYKADKKAIDAGYLVISIPTDNFGGLGFFKFIASIFPI